MPPEDSSELTEALARDRAPIQVRSGQAGTSSGINSAPGSDDDGWVVPQPVRLEDGSRIQLYKDGEALHAAYQAIKEAKQRICLEIYIFHDDETGRAFADLLAHKAREGVEVYLIYDSFGAIGSDRSMFQEMRRAGAHVQAFHPMSPWQCHFGWRPFNRDHRKLLVIDNHIAGLGGLNIGAEYAGSWVVRPKTMRQEVWRDNAIGIIGPSARPLLRSFARSWHYVTHGGRVARAMYVHNLDFSQGQVGVLASVPTLDSPLADVLNRLVRQAKHDIQLTMAYFAPSNAMINELCAAAQRGVRVRLMLPGRCDIMLLVWAARSFYEKLPSAGVEIYERQGAILHAKTMVIDGEIAVIGSTNLDYRSVEYNCELSVLIHSHDLGRQVEDLFRNDVGFSTKIGLEKWRRRPWRDRFGQWAVSRARYLL
jgi:cardiolipin synthase